MPRKTAAPPAPYAARVAARLRELRQGAGWSVQDLQDRLAAAGRHVPTPTLYAYERGKAAGGVDLPVELIPLVAAAFDFERPGDWLPQR